MLDVCLLGTGGMMPLPYRKLTACMTRDADRLRRGNPDLNASAGHDRL